MLGECSVEVARRFGSAEKRREQAKGSLDRPEVVVADAVDRVPSWEGQ